VDPWDDEPAQPPAPSGGGASQPSMADARVKGEPSVDAITDVSALAAIIKQQQEEMQLLRQQVATGFKAQEKTSDREAELAERLSALEASLADEDTGPRRPMTTRGASARRQADTSESSTHKDRHVPTSEWSMPSRDIHDRPPFSGPLGRYSKKVLPKWKERQSSALDYREPPPSVFASTLYDYDKRGGVSPQRTISKSTRDVAFWAPTNAGQRHMAQRPTRDKLFLRDMQHKGPLPPYTQRSKQAIRDASPPPLFNMTLYDDGSTTHHTVAPYRQVLKRCEQECRGQPEHEAAELEETESFWSPSNVHTRNMAALVRADKLFLRKEDRSLYRIR